MVDHARRPFAHAHLERLGHAVVSLLPESVGEAMLDEFGRLVLGRENSFRAHLLR